MFRKQAKYFYKSRCYSKFTFPTKESVCQSNPVDHVVAVKSNQVVCPWNLNQKSKYVYHDYTTEFKSKWKTISLYLCLPVIILMSVKVLLFNHDDTRPEFSPYEHLRIRKSKFPWGDGNKTFFHNPHKNALPDGYED